MKYLYLIGAALVFALGVFVGYSLFYEPPKPPVIVEVIQRETQYIKVPVNCDELRDCYNSPITITPVMNGDTMHIDAGDACKTAAADVKLECKPTPDWWGRGIGIVIGAVVMALIL